MIDIKREIHRINRDRRKALARLSALRRFDIKMTPLLPAGWEYIFGGWYLTIRKEGADVMEFKAVAKIASIITKKCLPHFSLDGSTDETVHLATSFLYDSLYIYIQNYRPTGCRITKKTIERVETLTSFETDDACLGFAEKEPTP